ncbi:hypothetical protein L227DRAFT_568736, partial [Lentinus tigrinus ALCF2SS1-6]
MPSGTSQPLTLSLDTSALRAHAHGRDKQLMAQAGERLLADCYLVGGNLLPDVMVMDVDMLLLKYEDEDVEDKDNSSILGRYRSSARLSVAHADTSLVGSPKPSQTALPVLSSTARDWELPSGINNLLPKETLANKDGYRAWAVLMQGALDYAMLWDIKDAAARTLILRTLSQSVMTAVELQTTSQGYWKTLQQQFPRTLMSHRAFCAPLIRESLPLSITISTLAPVRLRWEA